MKSFAYIDVLVALIAVIIALIKNKHVDKNGRIIILLLIFSFITEIIAEITLYKIGNKAPVFHFSAILNFLIVTIYFIKTLELERDRTVIIFVSILLICIALLNTIYLQPITETNTNIFILRSFCIVAMALIALYKILVDDSITKIRLYPHFYFWTLLLVMHAGTFFFWGLLLIIAKQNREYLPLIQYVQGTINALVYLGMGLTFLLYKRMPANERS